MRISWLFVLFAIAGAPGALHAEDCDSVPVWRDGRQDGKVCRDAARAGGLTVLALGEDWTPPVLEASEDGGPSYRASYLAIAQERFGDAGPDAGLAPRDRYFELFGIAPSFGVIGRRLGDEARHRCHDEVDDSSLADAPARIVEESHAQAIGRATAARSMRSELERDRKQRKAADLDALAAIDPSARRQLQRLRQLESYLGTVRAIQAHLACDGLMLARPVDGAYTWQTSDAVERFQRGAMILPTGIVDAQTLEALRQGSRERDFRTALRALRERVAAATGLIEDGSAGTGQAAVLGRLLDPDATWRARGHAPIDGAAPDLVSVATEAAAVALGWRDASSTAAFLAALASPEARRGAPQIAIALPPAPPYHTAAMALSVEIDRGDARRGVATAAQRPALILYATDQGKRIALVQWPTTIGGWQNENVDGEIARRWKQSPTGPRIWRDLLVGPRWLPPASTPDRELVRSGDRGYELAREQLGPSYRAAFGMVAFVHLAELRERGATVLEDEGIRTHGTGNLASIASGASHGCHRLLGRNVVRLADFVLAHRDHVRRGDAPTYYRRVVRYGGSFAVAIDSLGYLIELVPPVPIDVLPGRIR